MSARSITLSALLVLAVALAVGLSVAHAGAPELPCNSAHRMDTWWDEHGTQYECRCVRFPGEAKPWCSWFKVPDEGRPADTRKRKAKPKSIGAAAPPVTSSTSDPYLASDAWAQANGL